jgi:hypothetical protein
MQVKGLQATFTRWERLPPSATDRIVLSKELLSGCESIEWQVEELDRATGVAERDPARFSIDLVEIERRKKWIASTFSQVFLTHMLLLHCFLLDSYKMLIIYAMMSSCCCQIGDFFAATLEVWTIIHKAQALECERSLTMPS